MIYLANPCGPDVVAAMRTGRLGMIVAPARQQADEKKLLADGVRWCADNSAFGKDGYPGDDAYLTWLDAQPNRDQCLFAVAPDAICDHQRTYRRSFAPLARIRDIGYPAAFVAQNGAQPYNVPWPTFDVLFLGGDTEWKLGAAARRLASEAKRLGKWVHMGRVNSERRLRYADHIGCDSADGTFLTFGPKTNLPRLETWLRGVIDQRTLWEAS